VGSWARRVTEGGREEWRGPWVGCLTLFCRLVGGGAEGSRGKPGRASEGSV
jgi:hypothetical protein